MQRHRRYEAPPLPGPDQLVVLRMQEALVNAPHPKPHPRCHKRLVLQAPRLPSPDELVVLHMHRAPYKFATKTRLQSVPVIQRNCLRCHHCSALISCLSCNCTKPLS